MERVQDRQPPLEVFVGRAAELARMAQVVASVETGQPWLVTIEGEPGVGKTALARRSLAGTAIATGIAIGTGTGTGAGSEGFRVLSARADQAEADLDFGLVDQWLRGAGASSSLAAPLAASVGGTGPAASSFAVGAQLLEVVGAQLAVGPVAIFLDDLQWADRKSVEALTFMLRRLSVDPVLAVVTYRRPQERLNEAARRLLSSVENRLPIMLEGLGPDEAATLVGAIRPEPLDDEMVSRLYRDTGGHPLYLRTLLSEGSGLNSQAYGARALPRSLAAAVGDHLRGLPPETRTILEMLAVLNLRMPLAQLGQAAQVSSPSAAIEPAVAAGLVDWWPEDPVCPVEIRHLLVRDAIYARIGATQRRQLHTSAALVVSEAASWEHRVAALDKPDEDLAAQLEQLARDEASRGRLALAATHLQWASSISPERVDRERRLLTAALHLMLAEESRGAALREAAEATAPSPLRSCVLGAMAFATGQLAEAVRRFSEALAQAQADPDSQALAALIANRLAGTYTLLGDGEKVMALGQQALDTGCLDPAAASQTRTLVAIGAAQVSGPQAALAELTQLEADPARVGRVDIDALSFRGVFRLLAGDLQLAIADLTASLGLVRQGATLTLGLRAYFYLAMAQYLAGAWDDVLLTVEQGFSAVAIHSRQFELPLLHLAAVAVPAGRGAAVEAESHAELAAEAAARVDYGQERVYAAMARALVGQATGDYLGMADALGPWQDASVLDDRSRMYAVLWRPLLAEGLVGSGQLEQAAAVLGQLRADSSQASYLAPALAWLEGWLAEQRGDPQRALEIYQHASQSGASQSGASQSGAAQSGAGHHGAGSPVYTARLLLAHGRLLRRTGQRRPAVDQLRRASQAYQALRAAPFLAQAEAELTACHLPASRAGSGDRAGGPGSRAGSGRAARPRGLTGQPTALALTSRETEVAHLVGKGMSNPEIAAELFVSRKAVEYHLGNIYAKCGLQGRQQLRRFVGEWARPAAV
jgi:DNA-binding CsgD family transcriptional regulator